MLVAHFAFLQSVVSGAEPPYFPLGRCKLRSNKQFWFACTWNVPGNRQQDLDTAFFLLSETAKTTSPVLWTEGKIPIMGGKSLPCSAALQRWLPHCHWWRDPALLLAGPWDVYSHICSVLTHSEIPSHCIPQVHSQDLQKEAPPCFVSPARPAPKDLGHQHPLHLTKTMSLGCSLHSQ